MAAEAEEIRATAYVGFDTITQQIEHKLLKRGFQFNVIVVGEFFHILLSNEVSLNTGTLKGKRVWESRLSSTPFSHPI